MSKAVLISIKPKWCALICEGIKTVEVRKTRPNIKPPFKAYIYETKGKTEIPWMDEDGHASFSGRGAVIAEFICDSIEYVNGTQLVVKEDRERVLDGTCISREELRQYLRTGKKKGEPIFLPMTDLFKWHISNLVVYARPKELFNFMRPCDKPLHCEKCEHLIENYGCGKTLLRPPQSWCYVEETK